MENIQSNWWLILFGAGLLIFIFAVLGRTFTIIKDLPPKLKLKTYQRYLFGFVGTCVMAISVWFVIPSNESAIKYDFDISINGEGTTAPAAGLHSFKEGTSINLTAYPAEGWQFAGWSGAVVADPSAASTTITMDGDKSITASFSQTPPVQYSLTINTSGSGSTTGDGSYNSGAVVGITATPADGWQFAGWSGAVVADPSAASTTITMDGDKSITASFSAKDDLTQPHVSTGHSTDVITVYARIYGNLDRLGAVERVKAYFVYGVESGNYDKTTIEKEMSEQGSFYSDLTDLKANTTYYYSAMVVSGTVKNKGEEGSFTTPKEDENIKFPDVNLKKVLLGCLNKGQNDDIKPSDLENVDKIVFNADKNPEKITNLTGLEYCKNLRHLDLTWNNITDDQLIHIARLVGLEDLILGCNRTFWQDISAIGGLTHLVQLDIKQTGIRNIEPLSKLKNLNWLSLAYNPLDSLESIKQLPLKTLILCNSNLRDLEFLKSSLVTYLETLELENKINFSDYANVISDFSLLSSLTKVTSLYLYNLGIDDLSFLKGLNNLVTLDLGLNNLDEGDLQTLSTMLESEQLILNKLSTLFLDQNNIKDWTIFDVIKANGLLPKLVDFYKEHR